MYLARLRLIEVFFSVILTLLTSSLLVAQSFQGKAYYLSKSTMELGRWGERMSEAQKKQIKQRLKNRLEKTYVLTFNKAISIFKEEEKLDAISGATDTWGKNFTPGLQYKNIKTKILLQDQEFYGKRFLVKDSIQPIKWGMGSETKKIGGYTCYKAVSVIPAEELLWYNFSWDRLRSNNQEKKVEMITIEAWYTPQIPVSHGPLEYWGLPGLILEVSAGNTTMLCSRIVVNPQEQINLEAPKKGKIVTKKEYQEIISEKMKEMRDMYRRR